MEPLTTAIITALTFLGPEAAKEGVKAVVKDAYDGLKSVIHHKWGGDSAVAQSVEALEAKPQSRDLAESLDKQVARSGAARDTEVAQALKTLTEVLAKASTETATAKSVSITAGGDIGVGQIETFSGTLNLDMSRKAK
jgi:hypothetical protein